MCWRQSTLEEGDKAWYHAILPTLRGAGLLVEGGRCIDGNSAAERLFGVAGREEFLGREISWFLSPKQPDGKEPGEAIDTRIMDAMRDGPRKFAWQCRRADGAIFDAEVILVPVHTDDADVILISVRDVCREERLPAEAWVTERRARMVTQRDPASIVIWDPEMNIRAVNRAFLQMTGCERGIVESMSLRDFEPLDRTIRNVADAVRSREAVDEEVTLDLPAGPRTLIRSTIPLVDRNGNITEVLTVYRNITP